MWSLTEPWYSHRWLCHVQDEEVGTVGDYEHHLDREKSQETTNPKRAGQKEGTNTESVKKTLFEPREQKVPKRRS